MWLRNKFSRCKMLHWTAVFPSRHQSAFLSDVVCWGSGGGFSPQPNVDSLSLAPVDLGFLNYSVVGARGRWDVVLCAPAVKTTQTPLAGDSLPHPHEKQVGHAIQLGAACGQTLCAGCSLTLHRARACDVVPCAFRTGVKARESQKQSDLQGHWS